MKSAPPPSIQQLWPLFFTDQVAMISDAQNILPALGIDLSIFAKTTIEGKRASNWSGRDKNFNAHFHKLQPEFSGTSWLSFLLACCIVTIRRSGRDSIGFPLFQRIITEYTEQVCTELNSRWLVSVCDTLADFGANDTQRALGLSGALLANTVKLYETERRMFHPKRPWPPKARTGNNGPLFDGLIGFWVEKGDMIHNLITRIESVSATEPVGGAFVREILFRLIKNDTAFRRIPELAGKKELPLIDDDLRARLERICSRRL